MSLPVAAKLGIATLAVIGGYLFFGKSAKADPPAPPPPPPPGPVGPKLNGCIYDNAGITIQVAQQKLMGLGYDLSPWGADGKCGDVTTSAVKKFQQDRNAVGIPLVVSGNIDKATADELKKAPPPFVAEPVSDYADSNGVVWSIVNVARNSWVGTPKDPPIPEYNLSMFGSTKGYVVAQIDNRAAALKSQIDAGLGS